MRWAYANGEGTVWYCDRVYKTQQAQKWSGRAAYEHALLTEMERLSQHHARRAAFVQRRLGGHSYVARDDAGRPLSEF